MNGFLVKLLQRAPKRQWKSLRSFLELAAIQHGLDRSGGCAFCNLIGPAEIEWRRASRSTLTLAAPWELSLCGHIDIDVRSPS
jgi:hypothetical protein